MKEKAVNSKEKNAIILSLIYTIFNILINACAQIRTFLWNSYCGGIKLKFDIRESKYQNDWV